MIGASAAYADKQQVPAGFEFLSQPQMTEVDVYYGGYLLASTMAEFDYETLTFKATSSISNRIPDLLDPEQVDRLLSNPLPLNSDKLCQSRYATDCGVLKPDSLGIIFDRNTLQASLFIAPQMLAVNSEHSDIFLPESSSGLSFLSDNSVHFSGFGEEQLNYNLLNASQLALGESRLTLRTNVNDFAGLNLDTAAWQRDFRGKSYQFGMFQANADRFIFMDTEQLVGLSIESSFTTRTDLEQGLGTEIAVFLGSRSRVEVYREGRLLSADYYDVGNQIIDTSILPPGSYEVELRIVDAFGNQRSETRFYSKSSRLPPANQDAYFVQLGQVRERTGEGILGTRGENIFRAGYSKRLTDTTGLDFGVATTADTRTAHTGLFKLGNQYELKTGLSWESDGGLGAEVDYRLRYDRISVIINARKTWQDEARSQLWQNALQMNTSINWQSSLGFLSVFARTAERSEFKRDNYGMRWRSKNMKVGQGAAMADLEISRNGNDWLAMFTVSYRFGNAGRSFIANSRLVHESFDSGARRSDILGSAQSRWTVGQQEQHRLTFRADRDLQKSIEGRAETIGRYGSAELGLRQNFSADTLEFSGMLASSFASSSRRTALGNGRPAQSAFLARVEGASDADEFEVLVDGSPRARIRGGQSQLVPVAPYSTYDVELRAIGSSLINIERVKHSKTVYPGNVIDLDWNAKRVYIAIGKLLDASGEPIANALLKNVEGLALTDAAGYFQAEIDIAVETLTVQRQGQTCSLPISMTPQENISVVNLGELSCGMETDEFPAARPLPSYPGGESQ